MQQGRDGTRVQCPKWMFQQNNKHFPVRHSRKVSDQVMLCIYTMVQNCLFGERGQSSNFPQLIFCVSFLEVDVSPLVPGILLPVAFCNISYISFLLIYCIFYLGFNPDTLDADYPLQTFMGRPALHLSSQQYSLKNTYPSVTCFICDQSTVL